MAHWLFKSEPNTWSWDDQVAAGKSGTEWDGVRNYQARNTMREMKKGDRGFFYHSVNEKQIVGIVEVIETVHPDSTDTTGKWECVNIRAVKKLKTPVSLDMAKETEALGEMVLVNNSRLSVQPVTDAEWAKVLELSDTRA